MKRKRKTKILTGIAGRIAVVFLAILIPIYAMVVLSTSAYLHSLQKQAIDSAQAILNLNLAGLSSEMKRVDNYYYSLQEKDANFQRLTQWTDSSADRLAYFQVFRDMVEENSRSPYSEVLYLYMEPTEQLLLTNKTLPLLEKRALHDALCVSDVVKRPRMWSVYSVDEVPFLVHTVGYSGVYVGATLELNAFMDTVKKQIPYEKVHIWINDQDKAEDSSLVVRVSELPGTKLRMYVGLETREITSAMPMVNRATLMIGLLLVVLLPVILILLFAHMIVRPMQTIVEGMSHLASGESDYRIPDFKAAEEFVEMKDSFNNMASEIQHLKILQYEEKLEREQMLLQNLLLQIRPHFLLNFFNQIFSMAELRDYDGIQRSSLYLSKFFRYLFRSDRIATLKSELELVDAYLDLMEEQYLGCFEVNREIDASLLSYRIPPLIVQNFVENIFKYAVSDSNLVTIGLQLRQEGDYVVMTISDDGPGMEEETLEKIRQAKPVEKSDGTHIGIYNSTYRLKKLCGEDCILDVQSVLTEGTCVRIMLPVKK